MSDEEGVNQCAASRADNREGLRCRLLRNYYAEARSDGGYQTN
jgi:hypothetical protein